MKLLVSLVKKGAKTMFFSSCPKVWKCKNAGLWQHLVYDGPIAEVCKDKLHASEGVSLPWTVPPMLNGCTGDLNQ